MNRKKRYNSYYNRVVRRDSVLLYKTPTKHHSDSQRTLNCHHNIFNLF